MTDHITAARLREWPTPDVIARDVFRRAADALDAKDVEIARLRRAATRRNSDAWAKRHIALGMSAAARHALSQAPSGEDGSRSKIERE